MNLTLRKKICQSIIVKADPEKHINEFGSIENFLNKYPVGGIFVGREVCTYKQESIAAIDVISEYKKYSKIPLLICMDAENGVNGIIDNAVELPPLLCVGAANDEALAYDYAKAIAGESRPLGVNWTFAPVCDLNINPLNLIVNKRSLGDDLNRSEKLLKALIKGYQENGLLATVKHFPGDGVDYRNQHITKSENSLSYDAWFEKSGRMFQTAIDSGVDAIMAGHICAPALQNDAVDNSYPPATLSYDLITKLLKNKMGFSGVVVSDALDMGGFLRWIYEQDEAEVKCFEIGIDMLLWPQLRVVDNIEKKVLSGQISTERVEDAFGRIIKMKEKIKTPDLLYDTHEFSLKTAQSLAKKGTYIIKNSLLPLDSKKYKKIRIVGISTEKNNMEKLKFLKEEFEKRGAVVEIYESWCNYHADFSTLDRNYDLLLYAYMLSPDVPNPIGVPAVTIHNSLIFDTDKTIIASFTTPYIYSQYCETAKTYINCYENEISMRTFVAGLYGECEFEGTAPVKI